MKIAFDRRTVPKSQPFFLLNRTFSVVSDCPYGFLVFDFEINLLKTIATLRQE
jgi:hypothetical protein